MFYPAFGKESPGIHWKRMRRLQFEWLEVTKDAEHPEPVTLEPGTIAT